MMRPRLRATLYVVAYVAFITLAEALLRRNLAAASLPSLLRYASARLPYELARLSHRVSGSRPRVVISLTSNPARIKALPFQRAVRALCNQVPRPDAVWLHLPRAHSRVAGSWELPAWLLQLNSSQDSPLRLHSPPVDYGPGTKLLGALLVEEDPATWILYLDDDSVYSPGVLQTMLDQTHLQPFSALGFMGGVVETAGAVATCNVWPGATSAPVQVLEGKGCVLVQRAMFGTDIFETFLRAPNVCSRGDDLFISGAAAASGTIIL